ncbi:MAG: T9SS type A sorting domain-containing protein [Bacteroidetes bacterium]|nr:T9SS type A sorting domain-containing protein [Fibrella sp.]
MYPNPVSDKLYVAGISLRSAILIYDVAGWLLHQRNSTGFTPWLFTDALPAGIYYLRGQSNLNTTDRRFTKMP